MWQYAGACLDAASKSKLALPLEWPVASALSSRERLWPPSKPPLAVHLTPAPLFHTAVPLA